MVSLIQPTQHEGLEPIQVAGLKLWYKIQTTNPKGIESLLAEDFTAEAYGSMNGHTSVTQLDAKDFVKMCMKVGQSLNDIKNLKFQYAYGTWGESNRQAYLISYEQNLVFTPGLEKEFKMFSKGLQVIEWMETNGKVLFTKIWDFEMDQVSRLQQDQVHNSQLKEAYKLLQKFENPIQEEAFAELPVKDDQVLQLAQKAIELSLDQATENTKNTEKEGEGSSGGQSNEQGSQQEKKNQCTIF